MDFAGQQHITVCVGWFTSKDTLTPSFTSAIEKVMLVEFDFISRFWKTNQNMSLIPKWKRKLHFTVS